MNIIYYRILLILFYLILILGSPAVWSSNLEKIQKTEPTVFLNKMIFFDYNENKIDVISQDIDYYILNFWASWCAPCVKEMKSLDSLKKKISKVKILTISQDADIQNSISFFKKNKYENLEKYYDYNKQTSKNFSLRGLPTTFIFNKEHISIGKVEGIIEWDSKEFIEWLKKN
ncbi:TlpA family protein disulfide reductase [Alphaproteobacteria bacterium]|nr:TlpA family protein disulfide reductase [Alphaproteobacteria bacterium]